MFNITQFRELLIRPVLDSLQMYSKDAEELLVFTCAAESNGGTYLHQVKGPALGIYQCEPSTHTDLWYNYIFHRHSLASILALKFNCPRIPDSDRLLWDLNYATAVCRLDYRREAEPLPSHTDAESIFDYYKKYYNTSKGKSKKDKALEAYEAFLKSS
jgi:hypothetical protein